MSQRREALVIDDYRFSADDNFEGTMKTNLVVQHNGSILFVPPGILKSICLFNIASFPFVSGPGILFSVPFWILFFGIYKTVPWNSDLGRLMNQVWLSAVLWSKVSASKGEFRLF